MSNLENAVNSFIAAVTDPVNGYDLGADAEGFRTFLKEQALVIFRPLVDAQTSTAVAAEAGEPAAAVAGGIDMAQLAAMLGLVPAAAPAGKPTRKGTRTGWQVFQGAWNKKMKETKNAEYAANSTIAARAKMCGTAWKSLSDAEKAPYKVQAKATVA